jgi:hypothetical protein
MKTFAQNARAVLNKHNEEVWEYKPRFSFPEKTQADKTFD